MQRPFASRRDFLKVSAAAALAGSGMLPARAAADPSRIALVIGNNRYQQAPLGNAVNDAESVGALFERAGFAVTLKTDVNRAELREAATTFGIAARGSETKQVFFYYAGHGAQMDWRNFLVPIDARINSAADLPAECLELGVLLNDLSKAKGKTFVLILDACRDNPFGAGFRPAQKGLSQFDAPAGSLLAFATSPGSVAADSLAKDGSGANGLYTGNLVRELSVRGVRLEDALKRVRLAVRVASRGAQVPWESTSLESDVFIFPVPASKLSEAELEADFQREIATWNRIKGSKQADDWIGYLRDYPSGKFNEVAQNRLNYLLRAEEERLALAKPAVIAMAEPPVSSGAPVASPAPVVIASASAPRVNGRPALEIGPGLPVPTLMRPSLNPASAGTYPCNRRFSVGDEAVYAVSDAVFRGKETTEVLHITRVDEDGDRVEINDGFYIFDTMGNYLKLRDGLYEPRLQAVPAEFQIGRKWTTRYRVSDQGRVAESYFDYNIVARETLRVPAGEFDSFKLVATGFNITNRVQLSRRIWLVPGFNFALRTEWEAAPNNSMTRTGEVRELISCKQIRWDMV